jgi:hypothetical protein
VALSRLTNGVVGGSLTLNLEFAFGHGCDCPSYVTFHCGRRAAGRKAVFDEIETLLAGAIHTERHGNHERLFSLARRVKAIERGQPTNWQAFTSTNLSVPTPADGVYVVTVGLRGLPPNATQSWQSVTLFRDTTPPSVSSLQPLSASPAG